ncbi:MAG: hypothetical protein R3B09_06815 [Nannocystaceae bacterium]
MTQHENRLSRRSMFSLAAGGATALAVGGALDSRPARAAAGTYKAVAESKLPAGSLRVPGDLQLSSELGALGEQLLARMKHAVVTTLTAPSEAPRGDRVFTATRALVGTLKPGRAARLQLKIKQGTADLEAVRKIAPAKATSIYAAQMKRAFEASAANVKIKREKKKKVVLTPKDEPRFQPPLAQKIEFQLNSVKCIKGTSGESGSDEILMGGHLITPGGVIKKIDRFKVSDDFDPGETRYYDYSRCGDLPRSSLPSFLSAMCPNGGPDDKYAGRKLSATNLGVDLPWPATVGLSLIMAEEDPGGGFGRFLEDSYGAIRDELNQQIEEYGTQLGGAAADEMGEAIGAVIARLLSEFIDWLVSLFDNPDDPIASKSWIVQLPSPEMSVLRGLASDPLPSPAGTWASPMKKLHFNGDGGKYDVRLHWRVRT